MKAADTAKSTGNAAESTKRMKHTARRPTIFAKSATDRTVACPPRSPRRCDCPDSRMAPEIRERVVDVLINLL